MAEDTIAPTVAATYAANVIHLHFSEPVTGVDSADFSATDDGGELTLGMAAGSGTSWSLPVVETIERGSVVLLSYTGTATIDAVENALETFSDTPVAEDSPLGNLRSGRLGMLARGVFGRL